MKNKLNKFIGEGNVVIPLYILKCFKKMNLTMEEFVFLMYLYSKQDTLDFNPKKIAEDLNIDVMEAMGYVSILISKGYLNLEVLKSENGVLEEVINLENFYEKISTMLINTESDSEPKESIFTYIEKEVKRPLNSIEIKTIEGWLQSSIDTSLIKKAISLALESGVYNLKYVDKMLLNWQMQGIKNLDDLNENKDKQSSDTDDIVDVDTSEWDWLDDEEYIAN